jgi:SAM-dependent methyltransferase
VLPNDDAEQERLDLQHHIWRLLLQGALYTAPLRIPQPGDPSSAAAPGGSEFRILDLGCGTGIWAIDMADEFPRASVFGVDLSPIQPEWVPGNCRFHVDDYEDEWTYRDDEKFDYVHGRALSGTVGDWANFYRQIRQNLKPGGWCEMQEYDAWIFSDDDSFDRAVWTKEWVEKLDGASKMFGKQINVAGRHKQWMIDAGFEDVVERVIRVSPTLSPPPLLRRSLGANVSPRSPSAPGPRTPPSRSSAGSSSCTCKCRWPRTPRPSSPACGPTRNPRSSSSSRASSASSAARTSASSRATASSSAAAPARRARCPREGKMSM